MDSSNQSPGAVRVGERVSSTPRPGTVRLNAAFGLLVCTTVTFLAPLVSLGEVDPLTGRYRLRQTDLTVRYRAIELDVIREFDGALVEVGLDRDGWTFRLLDKRILLPEEEHSIYLRDGAQLTEFIREGEGGEYTCQRNVRIVRQGDGFTLSSGNGTKETYDNEGKLTTVQTPGAAAMHFTYHQGRLATISAADRKLLRIRYGPGGNIERLDAFNGLSATYRYDSRGLLTTATDATDNTTQFQYTPSEKLGRIGFQTGDFLKLDHDGETGRIRSVTNRDGTATYSYRNDDQGQPCSVTVMRPAGTETYEISGGGSMVCHTDALGNRTMSLYEDGHLVKYVDAQMEPADFRYDSRGRLVEATQPDGGVVRFFYANNTSLPIAQVQPDGATTHFAYNDKHQLIRVREPGGLELHYAYNAMGLCDSITYGSGEHALREQFTYNQAGQLVGWENSLGKTLRYEYDGQGRLVGLRGSAGDNVKFRYDDHGNVTEILENGRSVSAVTLDEQLRVVESRDHRGLATRFSYDEAGRMKSVVAPTGAGETYEYDQCGRIASVLTSDGVRQSYRYSPVSLLREVTIAGQQNLQFQHDAAGRLLEARDPAGTVRCQRDAMGRPILLAGEGGTQQFMSYDAAGRLIAERDSQGTTREYRFDDAGNLLSVRLPNGEETRYTYDPGGQGHLVSVLTADNRPLRYRYDPAGRLLQETTAWGEVISYSYDTDNNVLQRSSSAGDVINYRYDRLGRQIELSSSDGYRAAYVYDEDGDLTRVNAPEYEKVMHHDRFGRLTSVTYPRINKEIRYRYDEWNRRTSLEIPGHLTITYAYDELGRLATIDYGTGRQIAFAYDEAGRCNQVTYPNGVKVVSEYDAAGPISRISYVDRAGEILEEFSYQRDGSGRVIRRTSWSGPTSAYVYDANGQLLQSDSDEDATSFEYSPGSQRKAEISGGKTRRFRYNDAGQLIQAEDEEIAYDKSGNMAARSCAGSSCEYSFDTLGRLSSVRNGAHSARYVYSPDGERIAKEVDGKKTCYVYDGLDLLLILDGDAQPLASFVHGPGIDAPLAMLAEDDEYFFLADHLGSIAGLADGAGEIVSRYSYGPFGQVTVQGRQTANPFAFTARFFDAESGLYYYRARYYDPRLGIFLSPDPFPESLDEPEDFNEYAYVRNDPVNSRDPLGWSASSVMRLLDLIGQAADRTRIEHVRAEREFLRWERGRFWGWQTPPGKRAPIRGSYTHWEVGKKIRDMRNHLQYLKQEGLEGTYQVELQKFKNQLRTHYLPRRVESPRPSGPAPARVTRMTRAGRIANRARAAGRRAWSDVVTTGKKFSRLPRVQQAEVGGSVLLTAYFSYRTGGEHYEKYRERARAENRSVTSAEAGWAAVEAVSRSVIAVLTSGVSEWMLGAHRLNKVRRAHDRYFDAQRRRDESPSRLTQETLRAGSAAREKALQRLAKVKKAAEDLQDSLSSLRKRQLNAIGDAQNCTKALFRAEDALAGCKPLKPPMSPAEVAQARMDIRKLNRWNTSVSAHQDRVLAEHDAAKQYAALAMYESTAEKAEPKVVLAEQAAERATRHAKALADLAKEAAKVRKRVDDFRDKVEAFREKRASTVSTLTDALDGVIRASAASGSDVAVTSATGETGVEARVRQAHAALNRVLSRAMQACRDRQSCPIEAKTCYRRLQYLLEIVGDVDTSDANAVVVCEMHGERIFQQIMETARQRDPESRLRETKALVRGLEAKLKQISQSLAETQQLEELKLPRADLLADLNVTAATAELFAARARAYAAQARRYLASLARQPVKTKPRAKATPTDNPPPTDAKKPPKKPKPAQAAEAVPDLVGKTPKEALAIINKRWDVAWIGAIAQPPTREDAGRIEAQMPPPGAKLEIGQTVRLDVYGKFEAAAAKKASKPDKPDMPASREVVYHGELTKLFTSSVLEALNENTYSRFLQLRYLEIRSTELKLNIRENVATISPVSMSLRARAKGKMAKLTETWQFNCNPVAADGSITGSCSLKRSAAGPSFSAILFYGEEKFPWKATRQGDAYTLRFIFTDEMRRKWSESSVDSDTAYVKKWLPRLDELRPCWRLERMKD